ncbi:hypothetical protein GCM10009753_72780 [Streptantibioticus ferralitis]
MAPSLPPLRSPTGRIPEPAEAAVRGPRLSVLPRSVRRMGFTGAWMITAHEDVVIAELAPRFLSAIETERAEPKAQERWERWRGAPLPDYRTWWRTFGGADRRSPESQALLSFTELTCAGRHIDDACYGVGDDPFWVTDDVWARQPGPDTGFYCVHSKEYPISSFFHAIGPDRAAQLPVWCGNFLLTAAEVRQSLPQVERALAFTPRGTRRMGSAGSDGLSARSSGTGNLVVRTAAEAEDFPHAIRGIVWLAGSKWVSARSPDRVVRA